MVCAPMRRKCTVQYVGRSLSAIMTRFYWQSFVNAHSVGCGEDAGVVMLRRRVQRDCSRGPPGSSEYISARRPPIITERRHYRVVKAFSDRPANHVRYKYVLLLLHLQPTHILYVNIIIIQ